MLSEDGGEDEDEDEEEDEEEARPKRKRRGATKRYKGETVS